MGSLGNNLAATVAFTRFGLGGRPNDVVPASPLGWMLSQLTGPDPYIGNGSYNTAQGLALYASALNAPPNSQQQTNAGVNLWNHFNNEVETFLNIAMVTTSPVRERLVWFWANHFALLATSPQCASVAGPFIREAIRPNVSGTFVNMLTAAVLHPAMIYSLANEGSVGPHSQTGLSCQVLNCGPVGINENLARECLELHTVGLGSGFTQADVDGLAMLLSGWTVNLTTKPYGTILNTKSHEPHPQTVLGRSFDASANGLLQALTYLGTHPATYQQLATKLVTHYVSDTPLASDIAVVANVLMSTGGNLAAAAQAVFTLSNAWIPLTKLRAPLDLVIAVLRAVGATGKSGVNALSYSASLGQQVWQPTFPNGYSDLACDWCGAGPMMLRADFLSAICSAFSTQNTMTVAGCCLGPLLSNQTVASINATSNPHDQLVKLFFSPEFQRR